MLDTVKTVVIVAVVTLFFTTAMCNLAVKRKAVPKRKPKRPLASPPRKMSPRHGPPKREKGKK